MAPKIRRGKCQICNVNESKYTCSGCATLYCSVLCYKSTKVPGRPPTKGPANGRAAPHDEHAPPLRPLTSLKWPYRDDPKPLHTHQYEAIARAGVTAAEIAVATHAGGAELSEDVLALRALAEAVEAAVRGKKEGALGLDWGE
ncbi:hypothetical protein B0H14DRAFT_3093145 [Mycena olivaceomarginata]|nr:hypothetical protein B0H14DRAFT_3093145 [Mycena olivaceomarginata]